MSTIETIITSLGENHRVLIPQGAMDHLESVLVDTVFAGSVLVVQTIVPTLFVKLSAKTAARVGVIPDQSYRPSYKLLTIEDQDGNTVSLVTFREGRKKSMHVQLDPADRQVQEFIRLIKQQECFCLDITVDHKKRYGTSDFFEVDGEHLEWAARNLVRATSVKASNDWSAAANAYQSQRRGFSRGVFLSFSGGSNHLSHAASSVDFITRGDDNYEPNSDLVMISGASYNLDWLASQHGLLLTDAPAIPMSLALSEKLMKIGPNSNSPAQRNALEALREQYPDEVTVLFPLLVIYEESGDEHSRMKLFRILDRLGRKRTYVALTLVRVLVDDEFLATFRKEWPGQELTEHPTRGGHPFTPQDFILFEELSIRHALLKQQADVAIDRFVRLTEFGTRGQVLESLANKISSSLLFTQLDQTPVLPEILPNILLKVKHPPALKLLTDSFWGYVEVLRMKMGIQEKVKNAVFDARKGPRIGRNVPCPCGSGKKHKRCCGR